MNMYNLRVYTSLHGILSLLLKFQLNVLWCCETLKPPNKKALNTILNLVQTAPKGSASLCSPQGEPRIYSHPSSYTVPLPSLPFCCFLSFKANLLSTEWHLPRIAWNSRVLQCGTSFAETEDPLGHCHWGTTLCLVLFSVLDIQQPLDQTFSTLSLEEAKKAFWWWEMQVPGRGCSRVRGSCGVTSRRLSGESFVLR